VNSGVRTLTIHHGRHTFISHALAGGRTLAEVRAAAGHSNVAVTSVYLHIVVDEREMVGELFGANRHVPLASAHAFGAVATSIASVQHGG
jgi:integrase